MELIRIIFYEPTFNLLMFFYSIVGNLGVAILLIAVVSRLITWPLTRRQMKNAEKNKDFQKEVNSIKKKYKKNQEKQAQELAKIQAKYLPGQLGGCLNMIIALILLIQVRNVIINLVDQGVHAFNQVAYVESQQLPEDYIKISDIELEDGVHQIEYNIVANGNELNKKFVFALVSDSNREELTDKLSEVLSETSDEEQAKNEADARVSSISLYIEEFGQFKNKPIIVDDIKTITAHIRPPSKQSISYEESTVKLNSEFIDAEELEISEGDPLDFSFIGADLSKVATDFGFSDPVKVAPYVSIALLVGVTQIFATKVQMNMNPMAMAQKDEKSKKDKAKNSKGKKKKDDKPEELNFGEILAQSSKQMMYIFPLMTVVWSLGFFGAFFPTGVSLFWTGQNSFVIIQELITNKEKTLEKLKAFKSKYFLKEKPNEEKK
jgi:YidC/Oxa1 family membrane protein insertase